MREFRSSFWFDPTSLHCTGYLFFEVIKAARIVEFTSHSGGNELGRSSQPGCDRERSTGYCLCHSKPVGLSSRCRHEDGGSGQGVEKVLMWHIAQHPDVLRYGKKTLALELSG